MGASAIADVDGDGNDDLLVGQEDGTLAFYRHGESEFQHSVGDEDPFKSIDVGGHAAPDDAGDHLCASGYQGRRLGQTKSSPRRRS